MSRLYFAIKLYSKVSFIILWHWSLLQPCTHWPCWLRTWGGASSLTKTLISQSAMCTFASAFTLVMLALCVKCRRTLKGTLLVPVVTQCSPHTHDTGLHESQYRTLYTNWPNCLHYFLLSENVQSYKIGTTMFYVAYRTLLGTVVSY